MIWNILICCLTYKSCYYCFKNFENKLIIEIFYFERFLIMIFRINSHLKLLIITKISFILVLFLAFIKTIENFIIFKSMTIFKNDYKYVVMIAVKYY